MAVYVWRGDPPRLVDKRTGEPLVVPRRRKFARPQIMKDIPGHRCTVSGRWVEGRAAWRENFKINGTVPYERQSNSTLADGCINPAFAGKRGLPMASHLK